MAFTIPENITVHLGAPSSYAQNVTVPFADYVKNVASSEVYPTWPENALRANIYAQITFLLNRIFTEHYPAQGYDFDITNNTYYDQFFVNGRSYYSSVSDIVDEIFNSFIQRQGTVGPIFSAYCNGTTVTCEGLSQWGTVSLANQGFTPYRILQNYYGSDIDIVSNVGITTNTPSYPGEPLRLGDESNDVLALQSRLNAISDNYPSISKIVEDGIFGRSTQSAVNQFQEIFHLTVDGVVGKATWYEIIEIFNAVRRLAELDSEGLTIEEFNKQYPDAVRPGDTGDSVRVLQYWLAIISTYYHQIPPLRVTGTYDNDTILSVIAFQKAFSLDPDGIVDDKTWNDIYSVFTGITSTPDFGYIENRLNEGQFIGYNLKEKTQ